MKLSDFKYVDSHVHQLIFEWNDDIGKIASIELVKDDFGVWLRQIWVQQDYRNNGIHKCEDLAKQVFVFVNKELGPILVSSATRQEHNNSKMEFDTRYIGSAEGEGFIRKLLNDGTLSADSNFSPFERLVN